MIRDTITGRKICNKCKKPFYSPTNNARICNECKTYGRTCKRCGVYYYVNNRNSKICNKCTIKPRKGIIHKIKKGNDYFNIALSNKICAKCGNKFKAYKWTRLCHNCKKYHRRCYRCDKLYYTKSKRGRICSDCALPKGYRKDNGFK